MKKDGNNVTKGSIQAHAHIRQNAEEQNAYLQDLVSWEDQVKEQENNRQRSRSVRKDGKGPSSCSSSSSSLAAAELPKDTPTYHCKTDADTLPTYHPSTIHPIQSNLSSNSPSLEETCEKDLPATRTIPQLSKEQTELAEREKGNALFKAEKYAEATEVYTRCIQLNPNSAVSYSNRAMAYLKLKDWTRAESDASLAIAIDPLHQKSYQRRSAARASLGKFRAALKDAHLAKLASSSSSSPSSKSSDISKEIDLKIRKLEAKLRATIQQAPKHAIRVEIIKSDEKQDHTLHPLEVPKETALAPEKKNDKMKTTVLKQIEHESEQRSSSPPVAPMRPKLDCPQEEPTTKQGKKITNKPMRKTLKHISKKVKTWHEFERVWNSLSSDKDKSNFLGNIKPQALAALYKNGMENAKILVELVVCASAMKHGVDYIRAVSNIPSIDMVTMMATDDGKKMIRESLRTSFEQDGKSGDVEDVLTKLGC